MLQIDLYANIKAIYFIYFILNKKKNRKKNVHTCVESRLD